MDLEQLDIELKKLNYTRICVNSWVFRSEYCNAYFDVHGENIIIKVQTANTDKIFINHEVQLSKYEKALPLRIITMCTMLSSISQRTIAEIDNTLNYII